MRLFLALEPPGDVKRYLFAAAARLVGVHWGFDRADTGAKKISFTREENLHVTLKFLGEVAETEVPPLCEALKTVRLDGSLTLQPEGLELFPNRGAIHVIAAKIGGDTDRLAELHQRVEAVCSAFGFTRENRPFRPHITLARSKGGLPGHLRGTRGHEPRQDAVRAAGFVVDGFVLMESTLRPEGPLYTLVARFGGA